MDTIKLDFLRSKEQLQAFLALDERQLKSLTTISNGVIQDLQKISTKGEHILLLSQSCKKYETEREKVMRWVPDALKEERDEVKTEVEDKGIIGMAEEGDGFKYKPLMSPRSFKKALSEGDVGRNLFESAEGSSDSRSSKYMFMQEQVAKTRHFYDKKQ